MQELLSEDNPVTGAILGTPNLTPALMTDSTTGTVVTSFSCALSSTELQGGGANLQVYAVVDSIMVAALLMWLQQLPLRVRVPTL